MKKISILWLAVFLWVGTAVAKPATIPRAFRGDWTIFASVPSLGPSADRAPWAWVKIHGTVVHIGKKVTGVPFGSGVCVPTEVTSERTKAMDFYQSWKTPFEAIGRKGDSMETLDLACKNGDFDDFFLINRQIIAIALTDGGFAFALKGDYSGKPKDAKCASMQGFVSGISVKKTQFTSMACWNAGALTVYTATFETAKKSVHTCFRVTSPKGSVTLKIMNSFMDSAPCQEVSWPKHKGRVSKPVKPLWSVTGKNIHLSKSTVYTKFGPLKAAAKISRAKGLKSCDITWSSNFLKVLILKEK